MMLITLVLSADVIADLFCYVYSSVELMFISHLTCYFAECTCNKGLKFLLSCFLRSFPGKYL